MNSGTKFLCQTSPAAAENIQDYSHSVQYAKQHSLIPGPDDSDSRQYDGESLSLDDPSYPSRSILDYPPPMRGDGSGGIDDNECDRKLVEQAGGPAYHIASRGVRVMRIAVVGTIVSESSNPSCHLLGVVRLLSFFLKITHVKINKPAIHRSDGYRRDRPGRQS